MADVNYYWTTGWNSLFRGHTSQTSANICRISASVSRSLSRRFIISMIPPPGQNSMRMKTSNVPFPVGFEVASIRLTMFGWPLRTFFDPNHDKHQRFCCVVSPISTHHDIHFLLDLLKQCLVRDRDPFKHMLSGSIDGGLRLYYIYMCKATLEAESISAAILAPMALPLALSTNLD